MTPQPSQSTVSPGPSKPHFCPYCGAQLSEGYQFCGECGREVPFKKTISEQASSTFQSSMSVNLGNPPPVQLEKNPREVAITLSQKKAIQRVYSAPAGVTRIFGAMLGASAILVGVFDAKSTSLDPTSFAMFVLILSVVAVAFSGASRSLRGSTSRILRRGTVMELNGVPKMNTSPPKEVARFKPLRSKVIDFGRTQFIMPSLCTNLIEYGSTNQIVYAPSDVHPNRNLQAVLFLGVNQTSFEKAAHGFMTISGYSGTSNWSTTRKRRM